MYVVDLSELEGGVVITDSNKVSTTYTSIDKLPVPIQEKLALLKLLKVGNYNENIGAHVAADCYVLY